MATLTRIIIALSLAALSLPVAAHGQLRIATLPELPSVASTLRCDAERRRYETTWADLMATRAMDGERARVRLELLQKALEAEAVERPDDVDLQYVLTAAMGMRVEHEGGRQRIEAALELHRQARVVLELEPGHPGAQHILGRLHHAVLTMGRAQRFVATRLLGAGELAGASWDDAQGLLEAAVVGDPCTPDHHYALARLYLDRGEEGLARERLRILMSIDPGPALDAPAFRRAAELLQRLDEAH